MKEIVIHHIPETGPTPARVRVSYRAEESASLQSAEAMFQFEMEPEWNRLIKWYLEEYPGSPWGEARQRALQAEELIEQAGAALFKAVFGNPEAASLYAQVADDLPNTRLVICADSPAGGGLPWELIRDPARDNYGDLPRVALAFVRGPSTGLGSAVSLELDETTFNILMLTRPPGGEGDRRFESVARSLLELLRSHRDRFQLEVVRAASLEQLSEVLAQKPHHYHAVHLECAVAVEADGMRAGLVFDDAKGRPQVVDGRELGGRLAGHHVPMVFMDASQTGVEWAERILPVLGAQLIQEGLDAVVILPLRLEHQSRARFWGRIYEGLVNGEELGRLVGTVREEWRANPQRISPAGGLPLRDWTVPVLVERAPVRLGAKPFPVLHLNSARLEDHQRKAEAEIDSPPQPLFGFIGREAEIRALERAWQTETVVLLRGEAGMGKTETAMGFARWWVETAAFYGPIFCFHGAHYVPLAQMCDRVAHLFHEDIRTQLHQDLPLLDARHRRTAALALLRQIPCLIILDHFEFVAGYPAGAPSAWTVSEQNEWREFLAALAGGKTKVLLTSCRDESWLGPIYRSVELGGLSLAESQRLALRVLVQAGATVRQLKSMPAYNDLLSFLGGNPMAIQLVGPELRRKTPDQVLAALAPLAAEGGGQGILPAVLKYRLSTLDPVLRRRLGVLGLFDGYVSARMLAAISSLADAPALIGDFGREDWIRLLDAAAELGLVRRLAEGSYAIHPDIQRRFHDLLPESFANHLEWLERAFCSVCGRAGNQLFQIFQANSEFAMALLVAEQHNLMRAYRMARRRRDWEDIKEILCGLRALLITQGRWIEWEERIAELEAEVMSGREEVPPESEILWLRLLGHRAEINEYRGDFAGLQRLHLSLKARFPHVSNRHKQADVLDDLGAIAEQRELFDEAERFFLKSLGIKQQFGDEAGQGDISLRLGDLARQQRQFREAERWYRQSLDVWKRLGDADHQATTFCRLGAIGQERGDFDEAEQWYQQSLAIRTRLGDEFRQALALHQLGRIAHEQKQYEIAQERYRQSLEIRREIGDEPGQAATLHQLGRMARDQRRFAEAEQFFHQSLQIRERLGDETGQAQTIHQLGNVAFLQGDFDRAEPLYQRSLHLRERLQDAHGQARNLNQLGKIAVARGEAALADQFFLRAESLFEELKDPFSGLGAGKKLRPQKSE